MIARAISSSATCVFMLHCIMVGGCVTSIWNELSSLHNGISNFIDRVINLIKICHLMLKYTFKMLVENNYGHFETSTPCVSTFIYLSLNYSWLPITFNTDVGSSYIILGHVISVIATQIEHSREQDHVHDDVLIRKILQKSIK